jgi:RimJ/RimL family protein N-acetyltransferase
MCPRPAALETDRLRLVVLLPEEVEALIAGDAVGAGRRAHVSFPPGWPAEREAREGLPWHLRHLRADAAQVPWRIRVIVERTTGLVIGSINLKGPPDADGDVEIGWGLVEGWRGRGYALEAATAVMDWVAGQADVTWVSATIPEDNIASQRIAARLGLIRTPLTRRDLPLWRRAARSAPAVSGR